MGEGAGESVARSWSCGERSALARIRWWDILQGRLAGWSVLRVACVMRGALDEASRAFDICVLIFGNRTYS